MSTALEEPTYEEATPLAEPVTFLSTCNDLRIVRTQKYPTFGPHGERTGDSPGETLTFKHGRFVTSDPELVRFLQGHAGNGDTFHEMGMGANGQTNDDAPKIVGEIMELALKGEADRIADILLSERNSMSRPTVLAACESAITQIDGGDVPADPDAAPQI